MTMEEVRNAIQDSDWKIDVNSENFRIVKNLFPFYDCGYVIEATNDDLDSWKLFRVFDDEESELISENDFLEDLLEFAEEIMEEEADYEEENEEDDYEDEEAEEPYDWRADIDDDGDYESEAGYWQD